MLYNKNNVRKTNDKKILHKVGKQWKVISVALLMAIGGGAVATHAANAQSNNNLDNNPIAVQSAEPVKPASANNNQSASASASSVAPTSFVHGYAGSAASYRANAGATMNSVNSASTLVSSYVKSLNANMPEVAGMLNGQLASAQSVENSDNDKANSYSVAAANPANQSAVSSLAASAGYTNASDYVNYVVAPSASVNDENAKSTANYSEAINVLSAAAQSLSAVDWTRANSNANSESQSISNDIKFMNSTSSKRNATYSSVASASVSASSALSSASYALSVATFNASIDRTNGNASSLNNDNKSMANAQTIIGKINASSGAMSMAWSNVSSAADKASKASSALSEATVAANSVEAFTAKMSNSMTNSNSSAFLSTVASAYKAGSRASAESALGLNGFDGQNVLVKGLMASMLSKDGVNVASLYSLYQNKPLFNDVKSAASVASASMSGKSLTPANLYSVGNAMSVSASSNASSAASTSANYEANNNIALNAFYASSYADAAKSASNAIASLTDKANAGYSALLGSNATSFDNAVNLVKNAKSVAANYNSLAVQYAKHAQLVAPKFITITKDGLLHKSYNYGDANDAKLAHVKAGQQYQVLAYRIAANGALRFEIQVGDQTGYFTSANGYVESTYAFAKAGNKSTVNVNKDVLVYSNPNRTKASATGDVVKKGTSLNVIAVAAGADNYYGGYSVYEIMDGQYAGDFITSNVKSVSVPQAKANNNNNNAKPAQGMPSINF